MTKIQKTFAECSVKESETGIRVPVNYGNAGTKKEIEIIEDTAKKACCSQLGIVVGHEIKERPDMIKKRCRAEIVTRMVDPDYALSQVFKK